MDDARARIDLDALAANARALSGLAGVPLLAPVKANAYGHGAVIVARALERLGVAGFGVATAGEALELRDGGVSAPVLLLTPPAAARVAALVAAGVSFAVSSSDELAPIAREARAQRRRPAVHVKLNTGLNRLGARDDDAARLLAEVERAGLELEGVFTHLIDSEEREPVHAGVQLERFRAFLERHEPAVRYRHAANTGAVLNPALEASFDLVRPGIGLYGYPPGPDLAGRLGLRPVMTLESRVTFVKPVRAGEVASYGAAWTAPADTTLATVRLGYADGYPRALAGKARVLVAGEARPVVGRVCMDQILVDVTGLDVRSDDPVLAFGPGPVTAESLAGWADTNSYEILTGVAARVAREPAGGSLG